MPSDLTPDDLARLRDLLDKATPGEWKSMPDSMEFHSVLGRWNGRWVTVAQCNVDADAALIALAPALARAVLAGEEMKPIESERWRECIPRGFQPKFLRKHEASNWGTIRRLMEVHEGTETADFIAWMTWWNCVAWQWGEEVRDDLQERLGKAEAAVLAGEAERERLLRIKAAALAFVAAEDALVAHDDTWDGQGDAGDHEAGLTVAWSRAWEALRAALSPVSPPPDAGPTRGNEQEADRG